MTHHDRDPFRKTIPGGLRSSSPVDRPSSYPNYPLRNEPRPEAESERTRHHLHRFFEELLRRAEH